MAGEVPLLGATVAVALVGRASKATRRAVGHWSGKILQTRSRSAAESEVGAAPVRARRKKEVVVRWMNFMAIVVKNWK
jgi:hypothetical protein